MKKLILSIAIAAAFAVSFAETSGPDNFNTNHGVLKLLAGFNQGRGYPGPLVETSPGNFAGLARLSGQSARIFTLTQQGALTSIHIFPGSAIIFPGAIQAVNGRLYGSQLNPVANFSFDLKRTVQTYPQGLTVPHMIVQLVTGELYGAESNITGVAAPALK